MALCKQWRCVKLLEIHSIRGSYASNSRQIPPKYSSTCSSEIYFCKFVLSFHASVLLLFDPSSCFLYSKKLNDELRKSNQPHHWLVHPKYISVYSYCHPTHSYYYYSILLLALVTGNEKQHVFRPVVYVCVCVCVCVLTIFSLRCVLVVALRDQTAWSTLCHSSNAHFTLQQPTYLW